MKTDGDLTEATHHEGAGGNLHRRRVGPPDHPGLPASQLNVAAVRFSPGRTAWHSHVGGQTLYVTDGRGVVQARGQDAVELRARRGRLHP